MSRLTIPAACLAQLGRLADDDPPVLAVFPSHGGPNVWATHPNSTDCYMPDGVDSLLVTQSAPALLRVLARVRCAL